MNRKTDLLELSKAMGVSGEEEKFYRFAQGCLFSMQQRQAAETEEFFEAVRYCQNNPGKASVRKCMGISSQSRSRHNETARADTEIRNWCTKVLQHPELTELSAKELNQLMGYCARLAKIKGSGL